MEFFKSIKAGIGFLSTIPVGISIEGIKLLMNRLYLYPIIGTIIGLLIGSSSFIIYLLFPNNLASIITICIIYRITFFNHLDGLVDFGDGITAHGSLEKKRQVLKDTFIGIGGVAFCCLYIILMYSSLISLNSISYLFFLNFSNINNYFISSVFLKYFINYPLVFSILVLLSSEICAKQSMLTIATYGTPFNDGLGSITINGAKKNKINFYIGIFYSILIIFILLGLIGIVGLCFSIISSIFILLLSNKHFGGLNGDGIGFVNELGRLIFIISVIFILKIILIGGNYLWML